MLALVISGMYWCFGCLTCFVCLGLLIVCVGCYLGVCLLVWFLAVAVWIWDVVVFLGDCDWFGIILLFVFGGLCSFGFAWLYGWFCDLSLFGMLDVFICLF